MYINSHYPFESIKLQYSFSDLVPKLSYETLFNHYNNYYLRYLNKLNNLIKDYPAIQNYSLDELLFNINILPKEVQNEIIYNAGGVYNHQVFFESMGIDNNFNDTNLKRKLINSFGSIENFLLDFKSKASNFKGSGYLFLVCNEQNELLLFTTVNQDSTVPFNLCPLMCIDLWEHAYINDFGFDKDKYIDTFITLINWDIVSRKYDECLKYLEN